MSLRLLSSVFWRNSTETLGREYNNTIRLGFVFIYKTRVASENMTWSSTLRQPVVHVLEPRRTDVQELGPRQDIEDTKTFLPK